MRRVGLMAVLVVLSAGCGGGDDDNRAGASGADEDLVELLIGEGAPASEASCFAAELSEYDLDELEEFFSATSEEDLDPDLAAAFSDAADACSTDGGSTSDAVEPEADAASNDGAASAPPPAALPDHVVAGTPVDDSFALDVVDTGGFGSASSSCTQTFAAASGLDVAIADCIHVTSALSDWVAVIATLAGGSNELWMACSDDAGGFTFGLRWAGTVQGVTPMEDATIGSGLIVSLVDPASVVHHVVMWDQYEGSLCPTSTVESPGTSGTGPVPQAGGVYISLDGSDTGSKGVCYRPIDGVWTRGNAEGTTC